MPVTDARVVPRENDELNWAGRERRESERVIRYWEKTIEKLGGIATITALDLSEISSADWSHRFVISVDPVVENSSLLLYGSGLAKLLGLPPKGAPLVPIVRQLPPHLSAIFLQGCSDAHHQRRAVRMEGEIARPDGKIELYRAAFIPVGVKENSLTHLAFGAFNSRVTHRGVGA